MTDLSRRKTKTLIKWRMELRVNGYCKDAGVSVWETGSVSDAMRQQIDAEIAKRVSLGTHEFKGMFQGEE